MKKKVGTFSNSARGFRPLKKTKWVAPLRAVRVRVRSWELGVEVGGLRRRRRSGCWSCVV